MMNIALRAYSAVALAFVLGGCQSGGLPGWSLNTSRQPVLEHPKVDFAAVLEEGRAQLRTGNLSAAAASFRIASIDAAQAAEANNGLAIVYARIGRADLADRYFRTALAIEPDSQRFAGNLLRLQSRVLAARQSHDVGSVAYSSPAVSAAPGPMKAHLAPGKVERVARGVVHIRTPLELGAVARIDVAYRVQTEAGKSEADARIAGRPGLEVVAVVNKSKTYPVRIALDR